MEVPGDAELEGFFLAHCEGALEAVLRHQQEEVDFPLHLSFNKLCSQHMALANDLFHRPREEVDFPLHGAYDP